jgi:dTDP-4-amino-4,6-dideoxygalactose transaminase
LSLPMHPYLTVDQQVKVVDEITRFASKEAVSA